MARDKEAHQADKNGILIILLLYYFIIHRWCRLSSRCMLLKYSYSTVIVTVTDIHQYIHQCTSPD